VLLDSPNELNIIVIVGFVNNITVCGIRINENLIRIKYRYNAYYSSSEFNIPTHKYIGSEYLRFEHETIKPVAKYTIHYITISMYRLLFLKRFHFRRAVVMCKVYICIKKNTFVYIYLDARARDVLR